MMYSYQVMEGWQSCYAACKDIQDGADHRYHLAEYGSDCVLLPVSLGLHYRTMKQ